MGCKEEHFWTFSGTPSLTVFFFKSANSDQPSALRSLGTRCVSQPSASIPNYADAVYVRATKYLKNISKVPLTIVVLEEIPVGFDYSIKQGDDDTWLKNTSFGKI